ncbi:hypothetical protein CLAIMM_05093 [Cladophialophora immunda]|nr:hypothetical protein CLAIMM_05093 [Cladophialophora immunda]
MVWTTASSHPSYKQRITHQHNNQCLLVILPLPDPDPSAAFCQTSSRERHRPYYPRHHTTPTYKRSHTT